MIINVYSKSPLALSLRTDVDVQYHYELKPFETERALIRQAETRLKRMLETAPRQGMNMSLKWRLNTNIHRI